jgi:hypothetical protein
MSMQNRRGIGTRSARVGGKNRTWRALVH